MYCDAEIGAWSIYPSILMFDTTSTAYIDSQQRAGHSIKPRRVDNGVKFLLALHGLDASVGDGLDGGSTKVHQGDIVSVEGLVVVRVDTRPLGAVGIVSGQ